MAAGQFKEHFSSQGIDLVSSTPQAFDAYVKAELARWTRVLKEIGIGDVP